VDDSQAISSLTSLETSLTNWLRQITEHPLTETSTKTELVNDIHVELHRAYQLLKEVKEYASEGVQRHVSTLSDTLRQSSCFIPAKLDEHKEFRQDGKTEHFKKTKINAMDFQVTII